MYVAAMRTLIVIALLSSSCKKEQPKPPPLPDGVVCWGLGTMGQIGNGKSIQANPPSAVAGLGSATGLWLGADSSCALVAGHMQCWGDLQGAAGMSAVPRPFVLVPDTVEVRGSTSSTCVRQASGAVMCWGSNLVGQLGNGGAPDPTKRVPIEIHGQDVKLPPIPNGFSDQPVAVKGLSDATAIVAGKSHVCALRKAGTVACWGSDSGGQLGDGHHEDDAARDHPVDLAELAGVTAIAAAGTATCAITANKVWCWGALHPDGDVVTSSTPVWPTPKEIAGVDGALEIAMTSDKACARTAGDVLCWDHSGTASSLGLKGILQLAAGPTHMCARIAGGHVICWGNSYQGALGVSYSEEHYVHVDIDHVVDIAAGGLHTCVIRKST
ncbi:MAG: repeat-containing protein [Myxococcales bacterium]|nr:repeat-containing protein [Myxococcales bacterium]